MAAPVKTGPLDVASSQTRDQGLVEYKVTCVTALIPPTNPDFYYTQTHIHMGNINVFCLLVHKRIGR